MHRLELARRALRSLRRIPQDRIRSIFAALDELAALPDPSTHPNDKPRLITVLVVGPRGDIYKG